MTVVPDQVRRLLVSQLGVEDDEVTSDAHLTTDLGADSLDLFELVTQFEKAFAVELTNEDELGFDAATVADVVALLKARGAEVA